MSILANNLSEFIPFIFSVIESRPQSKKKNKLHKVFKYTFYILKKVFAQPMLDKELLHFNSLLNGKRGFLNAVERRSALT
jgi:hypothetical protein